MSGLQGSPQQDPPGEGLQPESGEGLQSQVRYVLDAVDVSPNSIVTPTPGAERLQQLQSTPTPNTEGVQSHMTSNTSIVDTSGLLPTEGWGTEGLYTDQTGSVQESNTEGVQSHVTSNTFTTDQPQDTPMTEAVGQSTDHMTPRTPVTPQTNPSHMTSAFQTPKNQRLIPTQGQTVLRYTRRGETPADVVNISSASSSSPSPNPKRTRTGLVDPMDVEAYGYASSESPSRIPETSSSKSATPQISYARMVKGKGKDQEDPGNDTSFMSRTWCKLKEFDNNRIPPITDVKYSVWLDMSDLYEDQAAIYRFAAANPYVCGLAHRPASKWMELYCKSQTHMEELLQHTWTVGTTEVQFIKAKKLAGSRIFLKLTNVTPCHSEDEVREDIAKTLRPYGIVGEIEPHYIVDFTNEFPDVNLCTRRWDAELFVPENTRLIMDPVPEILGTTTVIYWKGQYPVCHDCKVLGHWKKACNTNLRAQVQAARIARIPPAPIQTEEIPQAQPEKEIVPETTPAAEMAEPTQSNNTPKKTTPEVTPPVATDPQKETPAAPKPTTRTVKESEIIKQSRQVNIATGSAPRDETVIIRDDDGWTKVDNQKKRKPKTAEKRKKPKKGDQTESGTETKKPKKATLGPTAIEVSNRPRTVGNQLQYYLYMLEHGHILQNELQNYINKADAVTFITVTKPSMKTGSYESFTNWVGRRRRANKDDVQDIAKWKVSIPDYMDPTNPAYIDTSISAKQYNEKEEQRKNKQCKLTVNLPAALSPTETEQTQEVIFRPKDRMTTVLRNIKKKFSIGYQIDLTNAENDAMVNLFVIVDKAGIKDGSTVSIHKTITGSSTESPESSTNAITVRVQCLTSSKIWEITLPYTASTTHLYHKFQTENQLKHGSFTLLRSDQSRISRFTTLGNLHLRRGETIIYRPQEPIMLDVKWLDDKRQPQNKCVFVPLQGTVSELRDVVMEELLLNFEPMINIPGQILDGTKFIDELTESGKLEVHLRRIGQESWDHTEFNTTPPTKQIVALVMGDTETRTLTMEVGPTTTVADFANWVYKDFPEHKGKVLEDTIGLGYELAEMAEHIVPASGMVRIKISQTLEYSPEKLAAAVNFVAVMRSTTADALLTDAFSSFCP